MENKIKIYHAEDYKPFHDTIRFVISQQPDLDLVGYRNNVSETFSDLMTLRIDVLITDIHFGPSKSGTSNGYDLCRATTATFHALKVIAYSNFDDRESIRTMFEKGAMGFVSKKSGFDQLLKCIRTVYRGNTFACSNAATHWPARRIAS